MTTASAAVTLHPMFTIEHEFDASVITLIDDGEAPLREDVTVTAFDDQVVVEQLDARTEIVQKIILSMAQIEELRVALDLPEGMYQRET